MAENRRKKMIEVALPLEAINKASAREKSIRHGHPSTLHLWWARRPLAACRAVLFSSLVDDPASDPKYRLEDGTVDEEAANAKREQLFELIEELVKWENSNDSRVINRARAEIARCVASRKIELSELPADGTLELELPEPEWTGRPPRKLKTTAAKLETMTADFNAVHAFLQTHGPPVLDPFAGGGSIPLEAQRLGLRAHASDLNPVAVLINKALIEIPPKFAGMPPVHPDAEQRTNWSGAEGLAEDVRRYGEWMREEGEKRVGHLYPRVRVTGEMVKNRQDLRPYLGDELPVIAWLWARTVASPNPAMGGSHVPLVRSFWLCKKKGKEAFVRPVLTESRHAVQFEVGVGSPSDFDPDNGTVARQGGRCLLSGEPIPFSHIRESGKRHELRASLMAIVCEGRRERLYISPSETHVEAACVAPPQAPPTGVISHWPGRTNVVEYGMDQFHTLFTPRQLTALVAFSDLAREARAHVLADARTSKLFVDHPDLDKPLHKSGSGAEAYADSIATYLATCIDRLAMTGNNLCRWNSVGCKAQHCFGRQALPMIWDFAEVNFFAGSTGSISASVACTADPLRHLGRAFGAANQASAIDANTYKRELICTDPPYYDNVGYGDLSDFFYVWLRRSLRNVYPHELSTMLTPKTDELIASPYRNNGSKAKAAEFFESGLSTAISRWQQHGDNEYPTTIFYAFKQSETETAGGTSTGWETFLTGVVAHGLTITATWPVRTEMQSRQVAMGANALASSIVLACVHRRDDAPSATRREFGEVLRKELPEAICNLQSGNVAPVDLAQAAIGPGMAVFSRFSEVLNADGTPMSVRDALQLINRMLDEALTEQESDFDADTRWALKWFEQYGQTEGAFGDAETLAKAMAVSVSGVVESGIARSNGGKVRLLQHEELDPGWDPRTDGRLTIWEVTQHLIRRLESGGESGAAELLRRVGAGAGQIARELAYRLYQTCERKRWADEARSYNGLVVCWPEIERLSREEAKPPGTPQTEMFEQ